MENRNLLAPVIVNTTADERDGINDGQVSLRDAVDVAGTAGFDPIIHFDASVPALNGGTITLLSNLGQIEIAKSLTIDASGLANGITIDADDPAGPDNGIRIFNITDPIFGDDSPLVTMIGLTLTGGDVSGNGGAIQSVARLIIRDCTIQENEANIGGAIYVQPSGSATGREVLKIENSVIHRNDANYGGGVAIFSGGGPASDTVLITGQTTFSDNKAGQGGGVYADLDGESVTIEDSTFVLNEAQSPGDGRGGGVYARLDNASSLTVDSSLLEENDGTSGAGLYADVLAQSTLRLDQTIFDGNEATQDGGGVYVDVADATVEVIGSEFLQNDAGQSGGGLYALASSDSTLTTSTLTTDDTRFELNFAVNGGGGLYVDVTSASARIDDSSLVNNDAGVWGGGIYAHLNDDARVDIVNSSITLNEAIFQGGGVYGKTTANADATLEIRESQITGNIATDGGGVYVDMGGFDHKLANGTEFNLQRSRVQGNRAANRGGGVLTTVGSGGQVTVNESVITGNDTGITRQNGARDIPFGGGGMYAFLYAGVTAPRLTISGSEFSFNVAGEHGGGLALCTKRSLLSTATAELSVYNTTFSGNRAGHTTPANYGGTGGGVHLGLLPNAGLQRLDARFQNATITNNIADQGGGVWTSMPDADSDSNNDVRLTNSIVSANKRHNGNPSNLWGSFNIPATEFNLIGTGNNIADQLGNTEDQFGNPVSLSTQNILDEDDPKLAGLLSMGGPTRTHRPDTGSRAIDAGSNDLAVMPFTDEDLTTDQRGEGFPRLFNIASVPDRTTPAGWVDIGAYEIGLPKVIEVRIRDLTPPGHPEFNFSTVVGSPGEQLRTVPIGGADTINVFFSERVTVTTNAISVVSARTGAVYDPGTVMSNIWQTAWRLTPGNTFIADQLILRIDDALVTGLGGRLDGNWDNPDFLGDTSSTHTFPSGNNVVDADDDFIFRFTVLTGDFNHDNKVDAADYILWSKFKGTTSGATHSMGDANGDGFVNSADYDIWHTQFGTDFTVWPT